MKRLLLVVALSLTFFAPTVIAAAEVRPLQLWPGTAPGERKELPPEADKTRPTDPLVAGQRLQRLSNISQPTITIYSPTAAMNTGAAVLVCPGGGYGILALDLEGTEVCAWLNSIGVTAVLLKYRVPRREGLEKHTAPLQDAQRAVGLLRARAAELGIDPRRIGVLGFSAGGHLAAVLSSSSDARTYPPMDAADKLSCRPNFAILVYPAYLTVKEDHEAVAPELAQNIEHAPPTFIAMTEDDTARVETGLFYYLALKNAHVPAEMHVYPKGGHGYGLRRTADTITTWPERAHDWMTASGWLTAAK